MSGKNRLMKLREVIEETRMCKSKVYKLIGEGKFPAPIRQGAGASVWARSKIDDWIDNLIGEKNDLEKVA